MSSKILSSSNNVDNLDRFLDSVLSDVANGTLSISDAKAGLAEFITLVDSGVVGTAELWLKEGRKMIHTSYRATARLDSTDSE